MRTKIVVVLAATAAVLTACATVAELVQVQPPQFSAAEGHASQLVLLAPAADRPLGGAAVRVWSRVENPNRFGLTLTSIQGSMLLEGTRAAAIDLPIGLPLQAGRDTVIPIDVTVSFADLPGLADAAVRFATSRAVDYRVDGSFAVDAGAFGQPSFGPMTLVSGTLDVRR